MCARRAQVTDAEEQEFELTRPGGMHQVKYWGGGLKEKE